MLRAAGLEARMSIDMFGYVLVEVVNGTAGGSGTQRRRRLHPKFIASCV